MRKFLLTTMAIVASQIVFSQDFSNKGKDFWLVFPAHVPSSGQAQMGLFITSDKNSSGTISVNGFNTTFTVLANQVTGPINIPYANANVTAGESGTVVNKGIHVKTNTGQPAVVVYAHIYAGFRSEASLILPTNTLGKTYYSMNFWQASTGGSKSQFQIIATDTNTIVNYRLRKNGVLDATTQSATLPNRGDLIQIQDNADLSGSYIESVSNGINVCKKIAVFSGSSALAASRSGCNGGSYDPLYQQCYPVSTWGKEFGVVPLMNNTNGFPLRVMASENGTTVNLNGTIVNLNAGEYYPATTSNPVVFTGAKLITANKPIAVAQYLLSANCAGSASIGGQAQGDPDMIILNPVEQNISDINIFSSNLQNIHTKYLCVYMKTAQAGSFKINNLAPVSSFSQMPQLNGYSYMVEDLTTYPTQSFRLTADSGFNAITYGMGDAESYGYSAGTNVRDLYQQIGIVSQWGIESTPSSCTGSPFKFKISLPYQPDSLYWDLSACTNYTPVGNIMQVPPVPGPGPNPLPADSTTIVNGKTIYWYSLPQVYTFNTVGTYPISITAYKSNVDGCGNVQDIDFDLEVSAPPVADFSWISNGCVTDSVHFKDISVTDKPTYRWWWDFGEPSSGVNNNSTLKSPLHRYAAPGTYTVRFATITTPGCLSDTIQKQVTITAVPSAKFGISSPICQGIAVTFSDTSFASAPGVLAKWHWDFGDGIIITRTTGNDTTHLYNAWSPLVTDSLIVETNSGCKSPAFIRTFKVNPIPFVDFNMPAGVCLPGDSAHFFDASTIVDATQAGFGYNWSFGDPASGANNSSALKNPAHYYNGVTPPPPYPVKLTVTSAAGCVHDTTKNLVTVYPQAHALFTAPTPVCLGTAMSFTSDADPLAGNTVQEYYWDFGDITNGTGHSINHTYTTAGSYTVKHWILTDKGCYSDTVSNTVTVHPIPAISATVPTNPTSCLGTDGFITLSGLLAGQAYTVNYSKNAVAQPTLTLTANASGQLVIPNLTAGSYSNINCTANSCTSPNAATQVLTDPAAPSAPTPTSNGPICAGSTLNLFASVVAGASGYNWTGPNAFTAAVQNPSIPLATIAASGLYQVTVTVSNCVSAPSVSLNVVVNPVPVITSNVGNNPTTCGGSDGYITLSGLTPGVTYTVNYSKNAVPQPALTLTASAAGEVVLPNLTSGTYTAINCTSNNCTSANATTIILNDPSAPAAPTTGSNSPVCSGNTLNLTASAVTGASYTWTGPNGFNSTTQNPSIAAVTTAATGNYIVTVTLNNCTSAGSVPLAVVVNQTPSIGAAVPTNPTTCLGNEGFITLSGLLAGQTYAVNYSKNAVAQPILTLTANASGQLIIPNLTAGTYSNINCTINNCSSADAATQILTDPPLPSSPTASSNGPICEGSALNLFATAIVGASGYNWTGPNGFTSTLQNPSIPSVSMAASGVYTVTVTVNNCTSLLSTPLNVLVNNMPVISSVTTVNPSTCSGTDGSITLSGLLPGQTYSVNYWKNGLAQTALNLTASATGTVVITNLASGTYSNINCTANNCTSANAATQILSDPNSPAAPTGNSNSPICAGATLNLTAAPVANGNFSWIGPNAFSSTLQNPSIPAVTIAASGNYSVTVTVNNCTSTATIVPVTINSLPVSNFSAGLPVCETRTIAFTDLSIANTGTLNSWAWNFGDPASGAANTDAGQNPTHVFSATGTYTVTLTSTNNAGCVSSVYSAPVVVNTRPHAGFILPEVCLNDTYAQFTDTSSVTGGAITGWEWNFGDVNATGANPNVSNSQNPQHSYTAVGNYIVRLVVFSNIGCTDTITQVLTINGSFPVANFTVNNAVGLCANDSVSIVNTSSVFPGTITKVEIYWDNAGTPGVFDIDNSPYPNKLYTHLYPNFQNPLVKIFTIRFRAYSGGVCVNDKLTNINVNAAPKVQFTAIPNACLDAAPFSLIQATEIGGVPGSFVFTGPGVSAAGIFNPASVGPGTYTIHYTYTSTAGSCVDTASQQITVLQAPIADFSVNALQCAGLDITFTSTATTPVGTITTWTWDFGDGTPAVVRNSAAAFPHQFANAGTYTVTLRVTTSDGCISLAKTLPVTIRPIPVAAFSFPASVCLPNATVPFTNTSSIADGTQNSFTYLWNFGEPASGINNSSVAKNPTHLYGALGPFTINLQVISGAGCIHDTDIVLNIIHPQPKANFSINKPAICIGDNVSFADLSDGKDGTVNQWNWALGDATTKTIPSFTYTYTSAGTFNVSLYVVNSQGCNSDTMVQPFIVHPYPVVDAGPDRVVLEGGSVTIAPNVTGNSLQYLWTPSTYLNSNTSPAPVASNLLSDMTYTLTVTALGGCSKSDQVFVRLLKAPKIPNTFTPNGDGINDVWSIEYLNTYPNNRVQVFTRTGQLVFESKGYNAPWDGSLNGKPLPFDTYYYIIEPNNGRTPMTGFVTIVK